MDDNSIQDTIVSKITEAKTLDSKHSANSTSEETVPKEDIESLLTTNQRIFILILAVLGGFYSSLRRAYYVPYDETIGKILE